jgi:hypothetical protein
VYNAKTIISKMSDYTFPEKRNKSKNKKKEKRKHPYKKGGNQRTFSTYLNE